MHYTHNTYFINHQHFHFGEFFIAASVLAINSKDYLADTVKEINKDISNSQPTGMRT